MKIIAPFAAGLLLGLYWKAARAETAAAARPPLATIAALDVPRYMGTWYEIAKYPNRFQKQCASDTKATYSARADGRVDVVNRCRTADGGATQVRGVARQRGGATSPTLEVRFAPAVLSFLPMVWGDYWVVDLDEDYQVSVVSEPTREFLWILARTPHIAPAVYDAVVARLAARGFDTARLVPTAQARSD